MVTKVTETDFQELGLSSCDESLIHDFMEIINKETLGRKVYEAISQKEKGHFDKAMLSISEANRDQVMAIREIQAILDRLDDRDKTEVIFEKYRQTFPFQIGLVNGEMVLEWLSQINGLFSGGITRVNLELHANEDKLGILTEELSFFEDRMKGRISASELNELRENIAALVEEISSAKQKIVERLNAFVSEKRISMAPGDRLKLIQNLYLIITSCIETLDARFVEV